VSQNYDGTFLLPNRSDWIMASGILDVGFCSTVVPQTDL